MELIDFSDTQAQRMAFEDSSSSSIVKDSLGSLVRLLIAFQER